MVANNSKPEIRAKVSAPNGAMIPLVFPVGKFKPVQHTASIETDVNERLAAEAKRMGLTEGSLIRLYVRYCIENADAARQVIDSWLMRKGNNELK